MIEVKGMPTVGPERFVPHVFWSAMAAGLLMRPPQ